MVWSNRSGGRPVSAAVMLLAILIVTALMGEVAPIGISDDVEALFLSCETREVEVNSCRILGNNCALVELRRGRLLSAGLTKQQPGAVRVEFNATSNPLTDQPFQRKTNIN